MTVEAWPFESGIPVASFVSSMLLELCPGATIQLGRVGFAPRVQSRSIDGQRSEQLIQDAIVDRKARAIPFWDSLLTLGATDPGGLPSELAAAALFHQSPTVETVDRHAVDASLKDWISSRLTTVAEREILSLTSEVTTFDGASLHLPMLDFSLRESDANSLDTAVQIVRLLGVPGVIVASGASYHFYGRQLMPWGQVVDYLASALLLAPLTDSRWIGHQLKAGACSLRLSGGRAGAVPTTVVAVPA